VNPLPSRGLDIAEALAACRPDLRFAFQISWPLRRRDRRALRRRLQGGANVELRPHQPDVRQVYDDARVLLLPYRHDNRPRVIAEAQWNGIPVLASDLPSHRDAVGRGGVLVSLDAPVEEWARALTSIWDHPITYERLCAEAVAQSHRVDQDPEHLTAEFEAVTEGVVQASSPAKSWTP
jgi:glycosyltransferase involved in cell wall biosynthesis